MSGKGITFGFFVALIFGFEVSVCCLTTEGEDEQVAIMD
jgi:hypothetical protein